jgi:hypothetical protein
MVSKPAIDLGCAWECLDYSARRALLVQTGTLWPSALADVRWALLPQPVQILLAPRLEPKPETSAGGAA